MIEDLLLEISKKNELIETSLLFPGFIYGKGEEDFENLFEDIIEG